MDYEIAQLIEEVAPAPLVVSETAVQQLKPLLVELIERRKNDASNVAANLACTMNQERNRW